MQIDPVGSVGQAPAAPARPVPAAQPPARVAQQPVDEAQLKATIAAANEAVAAHATSVEFSVDPQHGSTIVRVVNTSTGELIRQMPSAEMIEVAKALDQFQGLLIRQKT